MIVLFVRAILIYLLVFAVMRISGKRQVSDLQPFDLVITLLIADLASIPVTDTAIPLAYGVVPILALFLLQKLLAFLSLKFEKLRTALCGKPLIIIEKGVVNERMMRAASYSMDDLIEQLRTKDVFSLAQVEYAILETAGDLTVLIKAENQPVTRQDMNISVSQVAPSKLLVLDGKVVHKALSAVGFNETWLAAKLKSAGLHSPSEALFVQLNDDGTVHIQAKDKYGSNVIFLPKKGETA